MKAARRVGGVLLVMLLVLIAYETVAVLRAEARTPAILAAHRARVVRLSEAPPRRIAMLLAVEDPGFSRHHGVDFSTPGQGATTLTQALVKRLYFDRFRPGFAKIEQSLIARLVFDPAVGKREQLELFLNYASFGTADRRPVIGFAAASQVFYGRTLTALDDRQFLSLVAMLMAPNALDPRRHGRANAIRVRRIEAMLAGRCRPRDLADNSYPDCEKTT